MIVEFKQEQSVVATDVDQELIPKKNEDYTVGWLCALPVERAAAIAMFDQAHPRLHIADGDKNSYSLGEIASHNVVVTCLPKGTIGTNAAATVATDMTRTFPGLRFILMVGIGGGAPNPEQVNPRKDLRLGDVVVSMPGDSAGGVIQYDFGRLLQSGILEPRGTLNKPSLLLRSAVSDLEALHLISESQISSIIVSMLESRPLAYENFRPPGPAHDFLFESSYPHSHGAASCAKCDRDRVVPRADRDDTIPKIHYGLIGSSNHIMKNADMRDKLRRDYGILCFETEAAGLMDVSSCLVIRGVCDYADSHKNKDWQPYAAITAAAYAKELLGTIQSSSVTSEDSVQLVADTVTHQLLEENNNINLNLMNTVKTHLQDSQTKRDMKQEEACLRALNTCNYKAMKNQNPARTAGTCQWALKHTYLQRWQTEDEVILLWLSADPLCGKSVLAKHLIDEELRTTPDRVICYFFFKDNEQQNSLASALSALLHQILADAPQYLKQALPAWRRCGVRLSEHVDELWDLLLTIGQQIGTQLICVLDGLDECKDSDLPILLGKLREFCTESARNITNGARDNRLKFLVTSRPYEAMQTKLRHLPEPTMLRIKGEDENEQIGNEIDLVIENDFRHRAQNLELRTDTVDRLISTLKTMKHRTYLWYNLASADIEETFDASTQPNDEMIEKLPKTVEDAYEKLLSRINPKSKTIVRRILEIVVGARRPFTIQEMALALSVENTSNPCQSKSPAVDLAQLERKIREWCGLFVFISDSRIYLIHETARDFLVNSTGMMVQDDSRWKYSFSLSEIEVRMTRICAGILVPPKKRALSDADNSVEIVDLPVGSLKDYAAIYWPDHARVAQSAATDFPIDHVLRLYDMSHPIFNDWFPMFWKSLCRPGTMPKLSPLMLAAVNGHTILLEPILRERESDLNADDLLGRTPLTWAAEMGHKDTIEVLINLGANVNHRTSSTGSALRIACGQGRTDIVQLLIDAGAKVNGAGRASFQPLGDSALSSACFNGHRRVVRLLLDHGADPNDGQPVYGNSFVTACNAGRTGIVRMLLDQGAGAGRDKKYDDALKAAAEAGHEKIVQVLLNETTSLTKDDLIKALRQATVVGHESIVRMLIKRILPLDVLKDLQHEMALRDILWIAASRGHAAILRIFLANEHQFSTYTQAYRDVVQIASARGHEIVMELLMDKTDVLADATDVGKMLHSAALAASKGGHDRLVKSITKRLVLMVNEHKLDLDVAEIEHAVRQVSTSGAWKVEQDLVDMMRQVQMKGSVSRTPPDSRKRKSVD